MSACLSVFFKSLMHLIYLIRDDWKCGHFKFVQMGSLCNDYKHSSRVLVSSHLLRLCWYPENAKHHHKNTSDRCNSWIFTLHHLHKELEMSVIWCTFIVKWIVNPFTSAVGLILVSFLSNLCHLKTFLRIANYFSELCTLSALNVIILCIILIS